MINVQPRRTEVEYRAIPTDSASTLKEFYMDPKKYFQKYVIGEPIEEEEDTRSTIIGSLVHCLLLEPDNFGDKYHVSAIEKVPTEKMLEFVLSLYKHTMLTVDDAGVQTRDFSEIAMDAYKEVPMGNNWKFETVMKKFEEQGEEYYDELLLTRHKGLSIVTLYDMKIAEEIIEGLKSDDFVGPLVNLQPDEDTELYREVQMEGEEYKVYDLPVKGMIDQLEIFHTIKEIFIDDLKVTWDPNNFYEGYYLHRRAYIQGFVYYKLVEIWARLHGYEDYLIHFPRFIVADSGGFYKPLIFTMDTTKMGEANNGFTHRGKYYKGVQEIITDLKWARDKNEWRMTRTNYINKGVINL
jgi:hypothetical protein